MPLSAVTFGGQDTVSSGSTTATRGPQVIAEDADLDLVVGVGEHRGGGHFGAGAGRGRHAEQRQDRAGNLVVADVIARLAAVRQDDGGDLGQVHVAAAAEAEDGVGPEVAGRGDGGRGGPQRRLRLAAGEDLDRDARLAQRGVDRLDQAGLEQDRDR